MPNMRVDVIYNLTSTDFELEFNLGACCQMRLFNTVTNNKKEYIDALAKAVTRSKIIIACGSIYGDEGLIRITAKATHKKTVVIDNSEYGIAQDMNVEIIDGSVPLVSTSCKTWFTSILKRSAFWKSEETAVLLFSLNLLKALTKRIRKKHNRKIWKTAPARASI